MIYQNTQNRATENTHNTQKNRMKWFIYNIYFQFFDEVYSYPIKYIGSLEKPEDIKDREKCENPEFTCPEGMTCCKTLDGKYGCCPFEGAQCCADGRHCCPSGYKCDNQDGTCVKDIDMVIRLNFFLPRATLIANLLQISWKHSYKVRMLLGKFKQTQVVIKEGFGAAIFWLAKRTHLRELAILLTIYNVFMQLIKTWKLTITPRL